MTDYDSPWKEALDAYFRPFLELFFAQTHAEIDCIRGNESAAEVGTEFQSLRDGCVGPFGHLGDASGPARTEKSKIPLDQGTL
jgi:hypothetical protein